MSSQAKDFLVDNELIDLGYQCNCQFNSPVSALPLQIPGNVGTSMVFPLLPMVLTRSVFIFLVLKV